MGKPIKIDAILKSKDSTSGVLGNGWILQTNGSNVSYLEVDDLRVRNALKTHIFQKDIVKATSGQLLVSDSAVVDSIVGTTILYTKTAESSDFKAGDQIQIRDRDSKGNIFNATFTIASKLATSDVPDTTKYTISGYAISGTGVFEGGMTAVRINGARILIVASDGADTKIPYISFYNSNAEVVRIGNIEGSPGSVGGYGLYATNVELTGKINATGGEIAGWTIDGDKLTAGGIELDATPNSEQIKLGDIDLLGTGQIGIKASAYEDEGIFLDYNSGTPRMSMVGADNYLKWNGSELLIQGKIGGEISDMTLGELVVSDRLVLDRDGIFATDTEGNETFSLFSNTGNATFAGELKAAKGTFAGDISAATGKIGGWDIGTDSLSSGDTALNSDGSIVTKKFKINSDGSVNTTSDQFYIDASGNATFKGSLTGSTGTFGTIAPSKGSVSLGGTDPFVARVNTSEIMKLTNTGVLTIGGGQKKWVIGASGTSNTDSSIYNGKSSINSYNPGIYLGTDGISMGGTGIPKFLAKSDGEFSLSDVDNYLTWKKNTEGRYELNIKGNLKLISNYYEYKTLLLPTGFHAGGFSYSGDKSVNDDYFAIRVTFLTVDSSQYGRAFWKTIQAPTKNYETIYGFQTPDPNSYPIGAQIYMIDVSTYLELIVEIVYDDSVKFKVNSDRVGVGVEQEFTMGLTRISSKYSGDLDVVHKTITAGGEGTFRFKVNINQLLKSEIDGKTFYILSHKRENLSDMLDLLDSITSSGIRGPQGPAGSDATVTKAAVEAVLTGEITSHKHSALTFSDDSFSIDYVGNQPLTINSEGPIGFWSGEENRTMSIFIKDESINDLLIADSSIGLGKIRNIPSGYFIGNPTDAPDSPWAISPSTAREMLNISDNDVLSFLNNNISVGEYDGTLPVDIIAGEGVSFTANSTGGVSISANIPGKATSNTLGLVRVGYPNSGVGRSYAVSLNNDGQMYVNVPWEGQTNSFDNIYVGVPATGPTYELIANPNTTPLSLQIKSDYNSDGIIIPYNKSGVIATMDDIESVGSSTLSGLSDVSISSLQHSQVLRYVDADDKWENTPLKTINGQSIIGSGNLTVTASNDFWDTPIYLGSGTTQPRFRIGTNGNTGGLEFTALDGTSDYSTILIPYGKDGTVATTSELPTNFTRTKAGLVPNPGGSTTTRYLREDGSWVTPPNTNTTYSSMSETEINSGTGTTARVITPARLKYAIEKHAPSGGGGGSYTAYSQTVSIAENSGYASVNVDPTCKFVEIMLHRSGMERGRIFFSTENFNSNYWMGGMQLTSGGIVYIDIDFNYIVENATDANYVTWIEHRWS